METFSTMKRKTLRGFATLSKEELQIVTSMGGKSPSSKPRGFAAWNPELLKSMASMAGRTKGLPKGLAAVSAEERLKISTKGWKKSKSIRKSNKTR